MVSGWRLNYEWVWFGKNRKGKDNMFTNMWVWHVGMASVQVKQEVACTCKSSRFQYVCVFGM